MDIIEPSLFDKCNDPVRTEELIYKQLLENMENIQTEQIYVAAPLAWLINVRGPFAAQQYIDTVCANFSDKRLFFVCQHIKVNALDFHGHLVFTPHATMMDGYKAIPHHSANIRENHIKPFKDRDYLMTFRGAFHTHWTRTKLQNVLQGRQDCLVSDTGPWHFEKQGAQRQEQSKNYTRLLGNTKVALCPRGTGPSSIRLWEAMGMGCVPMLISDTLKMPLSMEIPWEEIMIRIPEGSLKNINEYIPDGETLEKMASDCKHFYDNYFANDIISTTIIKELF